METLASQYYAQIGIGGMARPMVVGDRLWLFSQTPNVQSHPQSMNHSAANEAAPIAYARNGFAAGQSSVQPPNTPLVQSTRMPIFPNRLGPCNFLGTGTGSGTDSSAPPNYDFKSESFYRQILGNPSNTVNRFNKDYLNTSDTYFSSNQSKSLFNKFLWSNALINKPIERPYERFPFDMFANRYNQSDSHSDAMPMKNVGSGGGIAELERVFGSNIDQRSSNHPLNNGSKVGSKLNTIIHDNSDCPSEENSDVDCEQL